MTTKSFLKNEQGQDLIEYTLLLAFVALVYVALFTGAGVNVTVAEMAQNHSFVVQAIIWIGACLAIAGLFIWRRKSFYFFRWHCWRPMRRQQNAEAVAVCYCQKCGKSFPDEDMDNTILPGF